MRARANALNALVSSERCRIQTSAGKARLAVPRNIGIALFLCESWIAMRTHVRASTQHVADAWHTQQHDTHITNTHEHSLYLVLHKFGRHRRQIQATPPAMRARPRGEHWLSLTRTSPQLTTSIRRGNVAVTRWHLNCRSSAGACAPPFLCGFTSNSTKKDSTYHPNHPCPIPGCSGAKWSHPLSTAWPPNRATEK